MAKSKELEVKEEAKLPVIAGFEEDAGGGFGNLSASDYAIPFMTILQSLSPQVKPVKAGGVEGAVIGHVFNTVTKEIIDGDEGILVIPCYCQRSWIEWRPRNQGGGFVKSHPTEEIMESTTDSADKKDQVLPNGNVVVPTVTYYLIVIKDSGVPETVVISMTKTQIKNAKKWNSIMSAIKFQGKEKLYTPPMFSHKYRMTTKEEKKNDFSWYGWEIANAGALQIQNKMDMELYTLAKKLNTEVEKGILKAKPIEDEAHAGKESSSEVM